MTTRPRRIFRAHRHRRAVYVGREPLPSVTTWVEQHRDRFPKGELVEVVVVHESYCRYPQGGPCSCPGGPEIRVRGENPESN
jgi:hypothetical protein